MFLKINIIYSRIYFTYFQTVRKNYLNFNYNVHVER